MSTYSMRARIVLSIALFLLALPTNRVLAQSDDHDAILAVMERVFEAVSSSNPDDWRALQLADGTTLSFAPQGDGESDELQMRFSKNEDFIADLAPNGREYVERWTGDPTVMIRGPIAVVWGEYEFWIDGEFSHCGVDSVDLVKLEGEWKLANIMWTVELDGCPTDPSR